MNGQLLFGKYAIAPNALQYCGPQDNKALFEILKDYSDIKHPMLNKKTSDVDINKELEDLLFQFEGAVPYLKLIADTNKIKDAFDKKVVEAYWLGNNLLEKVSANDIYKHIDERFSKKMHFTQWHSIKNSEIFNKAKPFHNFHVFSIYSQVGLMRSGQRNKILETINNCMINHGIVKEILEDNVLVEFAPFDFDNFGNLKLSKKTAKIFYTLDKSRKKGDNVSLHWDYICDKLNPRQKQNLIYWTNYHLRMFNAQSR